MHILLLDTGNRCQYPNRNKGIKGIVKTYMIEKIDATKCLQRRESSIWYIECMSSTTIEKTHLGV